MNLDLDEQEFEIADNADNQFDDLAGVLQDILISQQFEEISNDFVKHNCTIFEESQDNKPEYMVIFKKYKSQMEKFIEKELQQQGFEMKVLLENFKDLHLDECIMETLSSLTDYELFKDIMVEAKARVEEEQRTIKQSTNKATKGYKQAPSQNIFSVPNTMQKQNKSTVYQIVKYLETRRFKGRSLLQGCASQQEETELIIILKLQHCRMKKAKLRNSLGTDTDFAFNDLEICKTSPTKKSQTTRPVVRGNMFYQKPTTTQLLRIRAKGSQPSLNIMRSPSLTKNNKFLKRDRNQSSREEEASSSNVMRRCISDSELTPMHSFFESNSLLMNKHDLLVQNITALPQSLKMQLHTNQYEIQKCIQTKMNENLDQTLIFTMFNTLHNLEKKILDPLFEKGNPVLNFKIKFLSEAVECVSDLVLMSIRRACKVDTKLGIFLENFWKFWVILIDITMQWLDKSCSDYIEYQVQQFKSQFKEAVKQKNTIEDQLMELQRELKSKELKHLHKIESMNQELLALQQEFNDYKITIHQMSDLKQAEQRMNSVGLRALELESVFKQYDRALLQSRVGFQKDFSSLGNAIIQQKKANQQLTAYQEKQQLLKCSKAIEDQSLAVYVSIHPFLMSIDSNSPQLLNSDMANQEILHQFLDHLITLDELNDNLCRVFKGWLNDSEKGNQVLRYIIDADIEMPFIELYCMMFGIKEYTQLSHLSVRQIMNNYKQLQQENEWTIYEHINTKEYLPYLELLLPEDFMDKFRITDKQTFNLEELLLLLAKHFHNKENKQWSEYIAKGQIDSEEYDHDLINTYLEIKTQLNKAPLIKQQLEEAIKQIRTLTLTLPILFCKPKRTALAKIQLAVRRVSQARGSSQRNSPIKRQSTYKAKK